jgi:hypothetical protein
MSEFIPDREIGPSAELKSDRLLDEHLFRVTSWMGRTMYVVEYFGKTVQLPLRRAIVVSQLIAADDQTG